MNKIQLYKFGKNQNVNFGKEYVRSFYINTNDIKKSVEPYVKKGWQFKKSDMFDFPNTYTDITSDEVYSSPKGYRKLKPLNYINQMDGDGKSWKDYKNLSNDFHDGVETLADLEQIRPIYCEVI